MTEYFSLPSELIEILVTNTGTKDLVRLCTLNTYYAKRCYDAAFWGIYLQDWTPKSYIKLLRDIAQIGNERLFFYLWDNEYFSLNSNEYRTLVELISRTGNTTIFFRLVQKKQPDNIALYYAYEAALFFQHETLAKNIEERIKFPASLKISSSHVKYEKESIEYGYSLKTGEKYFYGKLNAVIVGPTKIGNFIADIFAYGGNYQQLGKVVEISKVYLQEVINRVLRRILNQRYSNISLLDEIIKNHNNPNFDLSNVCSSPNKQAQKLALQFLGLTKAISRSDLPEVYRLTSPFLLRMILRNYPSHEDTRRILVLSYETLNDDEYLGLLRTSNLDEEEASTLYHHFRDLGYDYLADCLSEEYTFPKYR